MKKLTLLLGFLMITGATFAHDGKSCCKKGQKCTKESACCKDKKHCAKECSKETKKDEKSKA